MADMTQPLCCRRIIHADGNYKKAIAALNSFIESGGYDHWDDVETFAQAAAADELEAVTHEKGDRNHG